MIRSDGSKLNFADWENACKYIEDLENQKTLFQIGLAKINEFEVRLDDILSQRKKALKLKREITELKSLYDFENVEKTAKNMKKVNE